MGTIIKMLKSKLKKKKSPPTYPVDIFKELEESLNLIEDFDQIALNFIGKIKKVIPAEKFLLLIHDRDLNKFMMSSSIGLEESKARIVSFSLNDRLVKWLKINKTYCYLKRHPGILNYLARRENEFFSSLGIEICFPIISMNRLIGMLFLGQKEGREEYLEHELSLVSSLTFQTGIALENAILYKEQRERFRRMLRADKLATIGELAAGAAHEIRNPLTAIKSSLQYLETKSRDETAKKLLNTALEETERIDKILSALLSFSRPSEIKKEKQNLLEILEESLELISYQAKKQQVNIEKNYPASAVFLEGDRSQLKQLFLNLFFNSIQAMNNGGEMRVEVMPTDNQRLLIAISDTGDGIPEENLDRIFDPFFTTKKGGTGLGLSICYGIVKSHKGDIEARSKPGLGTTILMKFPQNL